ncbi:hypothetical protein RF679_03885 [Undibacterium cyanobacteriorum]|uniref:Uncharacterized protein n=1 Tax=Undibacterium cyanobacteriorum TaxID=3073561 RepID=A0ABY9RJN1_9BURK|nr:hypothetical protein [Undibacterium sp. 20NA77.5]WMW81428.1 hypothetical protein RF679_03885 [Undibacterium sp. 20NA77.5]
MSLRKILRYAFYVLATLLLLFVGFVVSNLFDAPLKPEAAQELEWKPPSNWRENNAFVILMALQKNRDISDTEAYAIGSQSIDQLITSYKAGKPPVEAVEEQKLLMTRSEILRQQQCDYVQVKNCVDFYRAISDPVFQKLMSEQAAPLRLFALMKQYKKYQEVSIPRLDYPLPGFRSLVDVFETDNIKVVRELKQSPQQSVQKLNENLAYSASLLKQSNTLIGKMVYLSLLQKQLRLIREIAPDMQSLNSASKELADLQLTLSAIAAEKFDLGDALRTERQLNIDSWSLMQSSSREQAETGFWAQFGSALYRKNATLNLLYDWVEIEREFASVDVLHYPKAKQLRDEKQQALMGWGVDPYYVRDPVAKIVVNVMRGIYDPYIERMFDMHAHLDLTRLRLALSLQQTDAKDIQSYAQQHGIVLKDTPTAGFVSMSFDKENLALTASAFQASNQIYQRNKYFH